MVGVIIDVYIDRCDTGITDQISCASTPSTFLQEYMSNQVFQEEDEQEEYQSKSGEKYQVLDLTRSFTRSK